MSAPLEYLLSDSVQEEKNIPESRFGKKSIMRSARRAKKEGQSKGVEEIKE